MTADVAAPVLNLAAASPALLTETKLTETRWRMGVSGRGELTGSFYFGADGRIKVFKSFNEATWRLRDGALEIFDERGTLAWHFDLMFQLGGEPESGQLVLFSGYRKPTMDTGVSLYLLEHRQMEQAVVPATEEAAAPAPGSGAAGPGAAGSGAAGSGAAAALMPPAGGRQRIGRPPPPRCLRLLGNS